MSDVCDAGVWDLEVDPSSLVVLIRVAGEESRFLFLSLWRVVCGLTPSVIRRAR